jgi:hypothetical protein
MRAALALAVLAGAALAQPRPASVPACPATFDAAGGVPTTCHCTAQAANDGAAVWGTGIYTSDSAICAAARHAGAVGADGGVVTVEPAPGRDSYVGTLRNGVRSVGYGPWNHSFRFPDAVLDQPDAADLCPTNFEGMPPTRLVCRCEAEAIAAGGTVWGTDVYSTDSGICAAAVHAGVITPQGGLVAVVPLPGQAAYRGSARNGITTIDWGDWPASFRIEPPK